MDGQDGPTCLASGGSRASLSKEGPHPAEFSRIPKSRTLATLLHPIMWFLHRALLALHSYQRRIGPPKWTEGLVALRSCWHTQGSAAIAMGQALQACATLHHQMAGAHQVSAFFSRERTAPSRQIPCSGRQMHALRRTSSGRKGVSTADVAVCHHVHWTINRETPLLAATSSRAGESGSTPAWRSSRGPGRWNPLSPALRSNSCID
mmetsp:Transcript_66369/g.155539  ORF Transcript_66369/g.155539 Transcript_66369/m.155539 type:complete len:206 (+) Transcript_66369:852-1469(+)